MPTGDIANIDPRLWGALVAAERELGVTMHIVSGHRTRSEQERVYARFLAGGPKAAKPGNSKHERSPAEAVDLAPASYGRLAPVKGRFGLATPVKGEPWHYELFNSPARLPPPAPSSSTSGGGGGGGGGGIADLIGALLDPRAWLLRLLEIVGGTALVAVGVAILARDVIPA